MGQAIVSGWTGAQTRALRLSLRMTVHGFAAHLGVAPRTVSQWESRGHSIQPRPELQAALDTALARAADDDQARFRVLTTDRSIPAARGGDQGSGDLAHQPQNLVDSSNVHETDLMDGMGQLMPFDRRALLLGAAVGTVAAASGCPTATSRHVAPEVPAQLLELRDSMVDSDSLLGPARLIAAVAEQLAQTQELLALAKGGTRQELFAVAALYAEFQGWLQDDVGAPAQGSRWTGRALEWAEVAGDSSLVAYMLMRRAQEAVAGGEGALAIGLASVAVTRSSSAPYVRAAALQQQAHGLAVEGEASKALHAMDAAWALVDGAPHDRGPYSLANWCTVRYVLAQRAAVLARLERFPDAVAAFDLALASWPADYRREEGLHLARKAAVLARADDLDAAIASGWAACSIAVETGSRRTMDVLGDLSAHLVSVTATREAVELAQVVVATTEKGCRR